jgi:integrase
MSPSPAKKTPNYVEYKDGHPYASLTIPEELRGKIGKRKYRKKLDASSPRKAQLEAAALVAGWKKEIALHKALLNDETKNPLLKIIREALGFKGDLHSATLDEQSKEALELHLLTKLDDIEEKLGEAVAVEYSKIAHGITTPLLPLYEEWEKQLTDYEGKTADTYRRDAKLFVDKFKVAEAITSKSARLWIVSLMDAGMTHNTAKNRVSKGVRNFWNYLADREIIDQDRRKDLLDIVPKERKTKKATLAKGRDPFTQEELATIHKALPDDDIQLKAVTTIAMYTGCRIEEICQLKTDGIKVIDGIQCLTISDSKTAAGYRTTPIHSKLQPMISQLIKDSKDGYLVTGLTENKYADRSNAVGKRFGYLKSSLGFPKKTKVFHTIRNCVITQLLKETPRHIVKDLVGHEKSDETEAYTDSADMKSLKKAIELINYPITI